MTHLKGTITALITPFIDEELDEKGLRNNIDFQLANKIDGLLLLGSTGESSTLSCEEQEKIITIGVEKTKGKTPLLVGTGGNCTREVIRKTKRAKELGADIALIVTPYYNKPTQEGLYRHFEAIATSVDIPIIIYNVPGRCGINIETSTLLRLAHFQNIIGIKDCSGSMSQASEIIESVCRQHPHFSLFSGDDILTLPLISLGAKGVISVLSNLIPVELISLTNAALQGKTSLAHEIHHRLVPFMKMAFIETNPIPIKTAMDLCGHAAGGLRLPLCPMGTDNKQKLREMLLNMKLIKQ